VKGGAAPAPALARIERAHPEWTPWLGVVDTLMQAIDRVDGHPGVERAAPPPAQGVPMLADARIDDAGRRLQPLFQALLDRAARGGAPSMAGLDRIRRTVDDAAGVFRAVIDDDVRALAAIAEQAGREGAAADGYLAVAALLPVPFLQACRRTWAASMPTGWTRGYCPVCGAWPSLSETCGIERQRYLRCGRCGAGWQMPRLACPYCDNDDHAQLLLLMVAGGTEAGDGGPGPGRGPGSERSIEACRRCRGYLKAFRTLQPGPGEQVMLVDLASIDLDIVATGREYRRPAGLGRAPQVRLGEAVQALDHGGRA